MAQEQGLTPPEKRGRGRPKGSKNKKTLEREAREAVFKRRGLGRPCVSTKKKSEEGQQTKD